VTEKYLQIHRKKRRKREGGREGRERERGREGETEGRERERERGEREGRERERGGREKAERERERESERDTPPSPRLLSLSSYLPSSSTILSLFSWLSLDLSLLECDTAGAQRREQQRKREEHQGPYGE